LDGSIDPALPITVTLTTTGSTAGFRARTFLRSLREGRMVTILTFVGLMPVALERVLHLVAPENDWLWRALLLGVGTVAAAVLLGVIVVAVRSDRPRTLVFGPDGIKERTGTRTRKHAWDWVATVIADERTLTLRCEPPTRSFRLASSGAALLLVVDRASPEAALLSALVEAHRPGITRSARW
jgi:hypothetical protein